MLREAAERSPDDPLVFARLAEIELSFGDLDAAQAAAERAVALAPELARTQMVLGFAALTRIDDRRRQGRLRAGDRARLRRAAGPAGPRARDDPRGRPGGGAARARDRRRARSQQLAAAQLSRQGLLRGAPRPARRRAVPDRQGARPERPDALVLRRDPPADREPPGRGAARPGALDRAQRQPRASTARACCSTRTGRPAASASARIYDDLGFEQLGAGRGDRVAERSTRPTASAHRFLSDIYVGLPRHEIARVSELLQAQLLQPININPVQPSLP